MTVTPPPRLGLPGRTATRWKAVCTQVLRIGSAHRHDMELHRQAAAHRRHSLSEETGRAQRLRRCGSLMEDPFPGHRRERNLAHLLLQPALRLWMEAAPRLRSLALRWTLFEPLAASCPHLDTSNDRGDKPPSLKRECPT